MSALAVAVVGGPLTMAFLALESTGSLPMTIAVLAASVVSGAHRAAHLRLLLRHLALPSAGRGDPLGGGYRLGAHLTVGRMMRRDMRTDARRTPPSAFNPPGPARLGRPRRGHGRGGPLRRAWC